MKKALLLFTCLFGISAQAKILQSEISKIKTGSPTDLIGAADTARASIDTKGRLIKLDFFAKGKWAASFETPLNTVHESVCDTLVYQGSAAINRAQVEIVVNDNHLFGNHCVSYFPVPTTGATLVVTTELGEELTYRMEGSELQSK